MYLKYEHAQRTMEELEAAKPRLNPEALKASVLHLRRGSVEKAREEIKRTSRCDRNDSMRSYSVASLSVSTLLCW